jgi:glycosyltransferase involved in cell wall biosynthesis
MTAPLTLDPLPVETPRVVYDVSRLLRRLKRPFGTGVDRIDLAIGQDILARFGESCCFVHASPVGPALLRHDIGARLLDAVAARWRGDGDGDPAILPALAQGAFRRLPEAIRAEATYVVASHSGLPRRRGALARLDPGRRMRRLVYLHDLIPIDFPEYQRPNSVAAFRRSLDEVADGPVSFVANSSDTATRIAQFAEREGWRVARIDVRTPRLAAPPRPCAAPRPEIAALLADPSPFFLSVGTIEPRKNHLLLLHLWRAFAAGPAPRLVLVGHRGWENEMVVDMLERCPSIRDIVLEFHDLVDDEVALLMERTRALLMPSFAEGLGLPVLEAAAAGTPMILSDLPALREIAPPGAQFLDPIDGAAWREAILAAAA